MKMISRLLRFLLLSLVISTALGLGSWSSSRAEVKKGFVFGPPFAQTVIPETGTFTIKRQGFPATYKETQTVRLQSGPENSYDSKARSWWLAAVNVVFWMSLVAAILSIVNVFFKPRLRLAPKDEAHQINKTPEVKVHHTS